MRRNFENVLLKSCLKLNIYPTYGNDNEYSPQKKNRNEHLRLTDRNIENFFRQ